MMFLFSILVFSAVLIFCLNDFKVIFVDSLLFLEFFAFLAQNLSIFFVCLLRVMFHKLPDFHHFKHLFILKKRFYI